MDDFWNTCGDYANKSGLPPPYSPVVCTGHTTGIVVSFNLEGEEELRENEELSEAFRFLDSVRPSGKVMEYEHLV